MRKLSVMVPVMIPIASIFFMYTELGIVDIEFCQVDMCSIDIIVTLEKKESS